MFHYVPINIERTGLKSSTGRSSIMSVLHFSCNRWIDLVPSYDVEYIPTANKVVVPPSVLTSPFFDPAYPL